MSVSLREEIEAGGYDLSNVDDCNWLYSKQEEFEDLINEAEYIIEQEEEAEANYIADEEVYNEELERDLEIRAEMGE